MKRAFPLAVLALFALVACSGGDTGGYGEHDTDTDTDHAEAAGLSDADRAAIEAADQAFEDGMNANDWAAVAALYTEDAILMAPDAPAVQGHEAIQAHFETYPPISDAVLVIEEIGGAGDTAWVRGSYTMKIHAVEGEAPIEDAGKFLEIRHRQEDGSWPLARDLYNSDIAPAAE